MTISSATIELLPALHRVNPKLPEAALTEAVYKLRNFEGGTIIQRNFQFMDYLQNGVSVNNKLGAIGYDI